MTLTIKMSPRLKRILYFQLVSFGACLYWMLSDTSLGEVVGGTIAGVVLVALWQRKQSRENDAVRHEKRMEGRELGDFYDGPGGLTVDLYEMKGGRPVSREIFTTVDGIEWCAWPSGNPVLDVDWLRTHYKFWVASGGELGQPLWATPARVDETVPKAPPF